MSKPASLDDRYDLACSRVLLNGMQVVVRLLLEQSHRDTEAGLSTGAFVSGYRGSPLGRLDSEMWAAKKHLSPRNIRFQPGVNEELAATSIWGAQQVGLLGEATVDGVFGLWYGKGPGVDRSGDVFKHANMAGTSRNGGVIALAGDDHAAKSSTIAHQSEQAFIAAMMPVLAPADLQDMLDFGLFGYALSRFAGCWVGMKVTSAVADSTGTVICRRDRSFETPGASTGLHIRWPENKLAMEARLVEDKLDAARAFARTNGVDRILRDDPGARIGIITVGKAHLDTIAALRRAGPELDRIRLLKIGMSWPLEPTKLLEFAAGLDTILVVEEKRGLVESQVKEVLYSAGDPQVRPRVLGKRDQRGARLLAEHGELDADALLAAFARTFGGEAFAPVKPAMAALPDVLTRKEFFCSGCPHNRSTRVPAGSIALAGIGCHTMASRMPDRETMTVCQMGGEGATWIGQAPFVKRAHVFQNLGDGTFFHSGLLAIRAAIAAKVNITYKLLFNDAVAMTGGQPVDGTLGVDQIARELLAEGAARVVIVTDAPDHKRDLPPAVAVHDRTQLDAVQRQLREVSGVTILIFEQVCAAEKRRRRKRKLMVDPPKRLFINERVCEGCGDCVKQSSCIALTPVVTPLGRKREIDQSACNKDYSCQEGFCPSFVELTGATLRKVDSRQVSEWLGKTPSPDAGGVRRVKSSCAILVTGVGGTGVVTIGAVLAMAAHLDGSRASVLDMTGLAQKNGAVTSHVILDPADAAPHPTRIGVGAADVVIACDAAVAAASEQLSLMSRDASRIVVNEDVTATTGITFDLAASASTEVLFARLTQAAAHVDSCPADSLARRFLGDSVFANMMMLGFAWQQHGLPVSLQSLKEAIRLNGAAVEANLMALELGRRVAAGGRQALDAIDGGPQANAKPGADSAPFDRAAYLTAYQNAAYAARYQSWVDKFRTLNPDLAEIVGQTLVRLMAIKDEYEVARLYTDGEFQAALGRQFEGTGRMRIWLAPPGLARKDPATGRPRKIAFGPWVMPVLRVLAACRKLRNGPFDVFGWTSERKLERRLLSDYEVMLDEIQRAYSPDRAALAGELLALPQRVRGFGHVKLAAFEEFTKERERLLTRWRSPEKAKRATVHVMESA